MKYKIRDGIVLINVCDEFFLVSGKSARQYCPYIAKISDSGALIWSLLSENKSIEEIEDEVALNYEIEKDSDLRSNIQEFLNDLNDRHYLMQLEDL